MRITDVEVIEFRTTDRSRPTRWTYGVWTGEERETTSTITRIATDEGVEGCMVGGTKSVIEGIVRPMLVGEDAMYRERLWNWMDQSATFSRQLPESDMGIVDCALWDLAGKATGLPVRKLLGGARDRVKAYASTFPNMGGPEVYAEHALDCKKQGYRAYKVHAYICWDPHKWQPAPQLPGFPREDVEVCRAVREAVGDDMVLMLDPFGVYTLEEAIWVGKQLQDLDFYWLEHPMIETRMQAYRRLTEELDIAVCSPEHVAGGPFSRAEWVMQGASDMLRIDYYYGGVTGCWKLINVCQAYGLKCELHGSGWPHLQLAAAVPEATCEYYERGLLRPGVDGNEPEPYLRSIPDTMDDDGNVVVSDEPGLGIDLDWDYIDDHRV